MSAFDQLKAIFINCSLKKNSTESHTKRLLSHAATVMEHNGVTVDHLYALDYDIAFGMNEDMTEHGWDKDDWPALFKRVADADILILGTPIWLGVKSSVCTQIIERLYSNSTTQNSQGQYVYYGKVGGCVVTGNEDGVKAVAMEVLYALQHIGYSIPPAADAGWIGEAGPGPSYGDTVQSRAVPAGFDNEFTNRNTTIMCYNLMHLAGIYKQRGGFPTLANTANSWDGTQRYGYPLDASGRRTGS